MSDFVEINEIFDIEYGNQLNRNELVEDASGINFISRRSTNLGVDTRVQLVEGLEPYPSGLITVTLGGSYLLSSFVQDGEFYTAQNIKVLNPKISMSFNQKVYYCLIISQNRFRYTSHGREANKTFDRILVPPISDVPKWVGKSSIPIPSPTPRISSAPALNLEKWKEFCISQFFEITSSRDPLMGNLRDGKTPYISSTEFNNGVSCYVDIAPENKPNVLTLNSNGSVGKAFYQCSPFAASPGDVKILVPKFSMKPNIGMFLKTVIEREKYRFNFGRKMGAGRIDKLKIKLPATPDGQPDWQLMENYINSLPYSRNL